MKIIARAALVPEHKHRQWSKELDATPGYTCSARAMRLRTILELACEAGPYACCENIEE